MYKGKVTRPAYGSGDGTLTLTATVTKGAVSKTKVFDASVKESGMTDAQRVNADKSALQIPGKDTLTQNIVLPTTGVNGSTITWATDKANVITDVGVITRPANGAQSATAKLTATITKGTVSETKEFTCTVLPWTDTEEVDATIANLSWDMIRGQNIQKTDVRFDLELPSVGLNNTTVSWISTNPETCATDGKITRPSFTVGDITVSLTYSVTKGSVTKVGYILGIKVIKMPITNIEAVQRALSLVEASTFKGTNVDLNHIVDDMILPRDVQDPACASVSFVWSLLDAAGDAVGVGNSILNTFRIIDNTGQPILADVVAPPATNLPLKLKLSASSNLVSGGPSFTGLKQFDIIVVKPT